MFGIISEFIFYLNYQCNEQPLYAYILGIGLCLGGIITYIPQYYSLIKSGSSKGINEISLLLLNLGTACLVANSFILNYYRFECYSHCDFWLCTANMLSFLQILLAWLIVIPLYIIFVRFKIKESEDRLLNDIIYIGTYLMFILIMVIFGISDKALSTNSHKLSNISAQLLGGLSTICSCIVWLPQILQLIRTKNGGNLSLPMFVMQTPGNILTIILQILYNQGWSTWLTYVVTLIEQATIVVLLLWCRYRNRHLHNVIDLSEVNVLNNSDDVYYNSDKGYEDEDESF